MSQLIRRVKDILSDARRVRRATFRHGSDVRLGRDVHIGRNVSFRCDRVRIGDGTVIKDNVVIEADVFEIGDFGTVYPGCLFSGPGEIRIGHNVWIGKDAVVDGMGGVTLGDNVCVGTGSQLWTHLEFGDVLAGRDFHEPEPMVIENDVWIGAGCLVAPVRMGARSLALMGAVVTSDLAADRSYGGTPAVDVTDKVGPQFEPTAIADRVAYVTAKLDAFAAVHGGRDHFVVVESAAGLAGPPSERTVFNVADRTYRKTGTALERRCVRWLLGEKARFVPATDPSSGCPA